MSFLRGIRFNGEFIRQVGVGRYLARNAVRQCYKRILRKPQRVAVPTGGVITIPPWSKYGSELYFTGCDVDWGSEAKLFSMLRGRGAFVDVGANIGYYSVYMAPGAACVYAFEPDERPRRALEVNVKAIRNGYVVPYACGSSNGFLGFSDSSDSEVSHVDSSSSKSVPVVTLDSFFSDKRVPVEAIKIDVERHDFEVLKGAARLLQNQRPVVLSEQVPSVELFDFLDPLGYWIAAFVKTPGEAKCVWKNITRDNWQGLRTKMIFLLPPGGARD